MRFIKLIGILLSNMETKQFLKKLYLLFFESGFTQRVLLPFKNTIIWINLLKYNNILKKYNKSTKKHKI